MRLALNTKIPRKRSFIAYSLRILFLMWCLFAFLPSPVSAVQKILKVGLDSSTPPFAFIDDSGTIIRGFSVDLARLLAGNMGTKLQFSSIAPNELKNALGDGTIDFAIGERLVDKSLQSLDLPVVVERKFFVHRDRMTITCVRDLCPQHRIVLLKGSELERLLPSDKGIVLLYADSQADAITMVEKRQVDAFLSPNAISTTYQIQKHNVANVKEVGLPLETLPLAVTVLKSNTPLLTQLSVAYGKITEKKNFDVIRTKWFGQSARLANLEPYLKAILAALGVFVLALLASFAWNRSLKKSVQAVSGELKRSEEKYRDLIESSPEMIHLISPVGTIRLSNKIAAQRLGYDRNEEFSLVDIAASEQRESLMCFVTSVFATGRGTAEFTFLSKDGERMEVEMTATMFIDPQSADSLACCFSRDVSERKRLEEELMQSERLAIMGQMTAGIAHEINNPLGIILANTEELLHICQGETRENLEAIERNALRAAKFIDDLLTFTRPTPTEKVSFDLVESVEEALLLCKQQLRQKGIEVRKEYLNEQIWLEGDSNQIQQVVVNLLLNSIQAIEEKGIISILLGKNGSNGTEQIELQIADTGRGIHEKDLPKIFDLFFTARKNKGFGLGLFICKRIVDKHNGTITVQSTLGRGTVIGIHLPGSSRSQRIDADQRRTALA
jgi:PAS domain S-box-containing protein